MLKSGVTAQHVEKTHLEVKSHNNLFGKLHFSLCTDCYQLTCAATQIFTALKKKE